ncbi:MAG: beta-ketoacyl synthase N-terminal-like domain-containing protein [Vicinamibacterales bacterium]|jgi:acyl-CoA synthetase (AMP-forming)/AMP-acid ligase II/3-oxoacyl-(acyl-carrier-protein) synthase/acyl carrier protein
MGVKGVASILERCVATAPGRDAYTFLAQGRDDARALTYGELYRLAGVHARLLRERVRPGDRVLLLQDNSLDFMIGFMACIFAGAIPVPVPPPDVSRLKRTLPRMRAVVADCDAAAVVASLEIRDQAREAFAGASDLRDLPWIVTDVTADGPQLEPHDAAPDDLALLQYTSGSTSSPKGVMVTHANILDNLGRLQKSFRYSAESTSVTWMPYFHDYGLIDGLLHPLYSMSACYVISPVAFIKRPWCWLDAVSRYRATHIHGPNFAYQLCIDRAADRLAPDTDLSSLVVAASAAEPVRRDTAERFIATFARFGFRPTAFAPAYGLAEATLVVSAKENGTPYRTAFLAPDALERGRCVDVAPEHPQARAVISCGVPAGDYPLAIVDPDTRQELPDDVVGEIWMANASVAAGYWKKPDETAETFAAVTAAGRGPMLRTGDLGFTRQGEIYLTGRLKDLLIIAGSNHYPHDIEATVEAAAADVRESFVAAFPVERDGAERLVVAAELSRRAADTDAVITAIRAAVSREHGLACDAIVLLPKGSILKTSSGKVQRRACKAAFVNGGFSPIAQWHAATDAAVAGTETPAGEARTDARQWAAWLRRLMATRKKTPDALIDLSEPFSSFGLSSIEAVEIAAQIEEQSGRKVPVTALWEYPSIRAFAAFLAGDEPAVVAPQPVSAADDRIAVIGIGCNFPGDSDSPSAFWQTLTGRGDAIVPPPAGRFPANRSVGRGGYLRDLFRFDAEFFGISDAEARSLDPQQRLLLETAWHALEDAGIVPHALAGSDTGVFVGVSAVDYAPDVYGAPGGPDRFAATGTSAAIIANRLSYFLDVRGPSLTIDTACSASLVAVHQACQALRSGDCSLAIVGGVNALVSAEVTGVLERAAMLSPTGRCRPFDAAADGYVRGEGCGLVVLKPLSAARRDGNRVLAVLRGSAVVQDGRSNGLSAPNGEAQRVVIRQALARAGVTAASVEYVEAHGTGTPLGDPIELSALAACYGRTGAAACRVGAVKGIIGHLEGAAGIAGLIAAILALQHDEIPALRIDRASPHAALDGTGLTLTAGVTPWPKRDVERVAAVSSFGFGGTLAHVIVGDDPAGRAARPSDRTPVTATSRLVVSARDGAALRALAARYLHLCQSASDDLSGLCASAAATRARFSHRLALSFTSRADLVGQLSAFVASGTAAAPQGRLPDSEPPVSPADAWALPLYPFGGRQHRVQAGDRSPLLQALAAGRDEEAIAQVLAHDRGLEREPATVAAVVKAFSALHQRQVVDEGSDRPGTYVTEWIVAETPPAPDATISAGSRRPCLLIGDSPLLAAAIDRSPGLRRVTELPAPGQAPALVIVHAPSEGDEAPDVRALALTERIIETLRQIETTGIAARCWVVTESAIPVLAGDAVRLDGACAWGAGKAAALEVPHLWGGLVDLPAGFGAADADALIGALTAAGDEDQLARRGGRWFVPRLMPAAGPDMQAPRRLRDDAVYWIVGGTGALGQHVLGALLENGARHVVLSGRGEGMPDAIRDRVPPGVRFIHGDITCLEDGRRVLDAIAATGLPLAGVVHAAGVAQECPIAAMTPEALRDVAGSKVTGSWNLHLLTRDRALDFFVCFSSISSWWGSAGQAHYAAGNHFLDLLCEHRRRLGLPGLAIGWGPWAGGGMVTAALQARLARTGLDPIEPARALRLFSALLGTHHARVAAVDVRWDQFLAAFTTRRPSPFLSRVAPRRESAPEEARAAAVDLQGGTVEQLRVRIRNHIGIAVAGELGAARVPDADRGLFDMGLDSIGVAAIRARLSADFGVVLSNADLFNYATINALTDRIVSLVRPDRVSDALSPRELVERIALEFETIENAARE